MVELKEAKKLEDYITLVEDEVVKLAFREGVKIIVERDFRGRYPTFTVRAVEREKAGSERMIVRKLNGRWLKSK
jgi:hypothetical protein